MKRKSTGECLRHHRIEKPERVQGVGGPVLMHRGKWLGMMALGLWGLVVVGCAADIDGDSQQQERGVEVISEDLQEDIPANAQNRALIGNGYNLLTEEFRRQCVRSKIDNVKIPTGQARIVFDRSMTREEATDSLGFNASAKAHFGLLKSDVRASFARSFQSIEQSINMVFSGTYELWTERLDESAWLWLVDPHQVPESSWYLSCGDTFTYEIKKGGQIFLLYQLNFASTTDKNAFEAVFGATYGLNELKASVNSARAGFSGRVSIHMEAYQYGGDVTQLGRVFPQAKNGWAVLDCSLENLDACNKFLESGISYANGRESTDFPANLLQKPGDVTYVVRDWQLLYPPILLPVEVPDEVTTARTVLEGIFDVEIEKYTRVLALITDKLVLPEQIRKKLRIWSRTTSRIA